METLYNVVMLIDSSGATPVVSIYVNPRAIEFHPETGEFTVISRSGVSYPAPKAGQIVTDRCSEASAIRQIEKVAQMMGHPSPFTNADMPDTADQSFENVVLSPGSKLVN